MADRPGIVAGVLLAGMIVSALAAAATEARLAQLDHPRRWLALRIVPRSFDLGAYPPERHALQARGRKWFVRTVVFGCLFVLAECIGI